MTRIHHPPTPRDRAGYFAATLLFLPLWLIVLAVVPHVAHGGLEGALTISFVLSPPLGLLFWRGFERRRYVDEERAAPRREERESAATHRAERESPVPRREERESPLPRPEERDSAATRREARRGRRRRVVRETHYSIASRGDDVFCPIIQDGEAPAPAPDDIRLACLRRSEGGSPWGHPLMILQCLCAAIMIWVVLRGEMYSQCLALPAALVLTSVTLVWLLVGGAWGVLQIKGGRAWLDDVAGSPFGRHERERVLAAEATEDGLRVTLERQGKVRLWFPEGSLPEEVQRDIALDALREHAGVPGTLETESTRPAKEEEEST